METSSARAQPRSGHEFIVTNAIIKSVANLHKPSDQTLKISEQAVASLDHVCSLLSTCVDASLWPTTHNKRPDARVYNTQSLFTIHHMLWIDNTTVFSTHHGSCVALMRVTGRQGCLDGFLSRFPVIDIGRRRRLKGTEYTGAPKSTSGALRMLVVFNLID